MCYYYLWSLPYNVALRSPGFFSGVPSSVEIFTVSGECENGAFKMSSTQFVPMETIKESGETVCIPVIGYIKS